MMKLHKNFLTNDRDKKCGDTSDQINYVYSKRQKQKL